MNIRKLGIAVATGIALSGLFVGGSASAARCGSRPDGIVIPDDFSTYNSPGEIISYDATAGNTPIGAVGLVVADVCGGAPD